MKLRISKGMTKDVKILTKKGYKNISNIIEGDHVLTHKGNFKKVVKKI